MGQGSSKKEKSLSLQGISHLPRVSLATAKCRAIWSTPRRQPADRRLGVVSFWCLSHLQGAEGLASTDNYLPWLLGYKGWKASEISWQSGFHFLFSLRTLSSLKILCKSLIKKEIKAECSG